MQNQPDPDIPVHERRWLDRLRAAWNEVRARPTDKTNAGALEAVAEERPQEAKYRIDTFAADAALRTSPTLPKPREEAVHHERDESDKPGGQATPETDRFDDEAGQ